MTQSITLDLSLQNVVVHTNLALWFVLLVHAQKKKII